MSVKKILRRHMMQSTGVGMLSLMGGSALWGCGDDTDGAMGGADGGFDAGPADGSKPWWLQGNFAPVTEESTAMDLEVVGALPPELNGMFVRNGSNPVHSDSGHWFIGDGMLHGTRIENGKALWYRNRYVQTPILGKASGEAGPPTLENTASNVSVVWHHGKLLSLGEVGLPYEINPTDLSTVGAYDYGGKLMTNHTAHPTIDPDTGDMLFFGYYWVEPYLTYMRANSAGELVQIEPIDVKGPAMAHSFAQTKDYVVFMDLPIVFSIDEAIAMNPFPFLWTEDYGARIGIMPKTGTNADVQWFEIDPCYIFHVMNAYQQDDKVQLEVSRYPQLWASGSMDFDDEPRLHRFTMNLTDGSVSDAPMDDRLIEFPQIDKRLAGRPYRYGYGLNFDAPPSSGGMNGISSIVKYDHMNGTTQVRELDPWIVPGETTFVPASDTAGEDEGYLITYAYDGQRDASDLLVLDATQIDGAPVAQVKLPYRVPVGFHGLWVPS